MSPEDAKFFGIENRTKWALLHARKLAKAGLSKTWWLGTETDHKLAEWVSKSIRTISTMVEGEMDNNKILAIARILGYSHLPEELEC